MNGPSSNDPEHRVVNFPTPGRGGTVRLPPRPPAPDVDAETEAGDQTGDDYRHRMIVNVAGLAFVALLIAAGVWLADSMAQMRKNEDCVLSGRRGCTPIEAPRDRW